MDDQLGVEKAGDQEGKVGGHPGERRWLGTGLQPSRWRPRLFLGIDGIGPSLEYTVTPRLALDDSGAIQQDGAPRRTN